MNNLIINKQLQSLIELDELDYVIKIEKQIYMSYGYTC